MVWIELITQAGTRISLTKHGYILLGHAQGQRELAMWKDYQAWLKSLESEENFSSILFVGVKIPISFLQQGDSSHDGNSLASTKSVHV